MKSRTVVLAGASALSFLGVFAACTSDGSSSPTTDLVDATADDAFIFPTVDAADDSPASDAGSDASDASLPSDLGVLEDFCQAYATAACAREEHCSGTSSPGCAAGELVACREYARADLVGPVKAGLLTYVPSGAATCFGAPLDDYCQTGNFWSQAACQGVFVGTVPTGGACHVAHFSGNSFSECATGVCLGAVNYGASCKAGTCADYLDAGAPCRDDAGGPIVPGCGLEQQCTSANTCAPAGKPGDPCTDPGALCRPLYPRLACAPLADGGAGFACDFGRAGGGVCGSGANHYSSACLSGYCPNGQCVDATDAGVVCLTASSICPTGTRCRSTGTVPTCLPTVDAGATCDPNDSACSGDALCVVHDGGSATCETIPGAGSPCLGGACAPGTTCSTFGDAAATCVPIVNAGDACLGPNDPACGLLTCLASTMKCAEPAGFEQPCTADTDCARGLYCDGATSTCLTWKTNGAACTRGTECAFDGQCSDAGTCATECVLP